MHKFIALTPIPSSITQPTILNQVRVHAPMGTILSVEPTLPSPTEDTLWLLAIMDTLPPWPSAILPSSLTPRMQPVPSITTTLDGLLETTVGTTLSTRLAVTLATSPQQLPPIVQLYPSMALTWTPIVLHLCWTSTWTAKHYIATKEHQVHLEVLSFKSKQVVSQVFMVAELISTLITSLLSSIMLFIA